MRATGMGPSMNLGFKWGFSLSIFAFIMLVREKKVGLLKNEKALNNKDLSEEILNLPVLYTFYISLCVLIIISNT